MSKNIIVYDGCDVIAKSLVDTLSRAIENCEIVQITRLSELMSNADNFLLVLNIDALYEASRVSIVGKIREKNKNFELLAISKYESNFINSTVGLKESDRVIDWKISWEEFIKIVSEKVSKNANYLTEEAFVKITKRQRQILILSSQGKNNQEIAQILGLSEHTIKVHAWRLYRRLGVSNRLGALAKARKMGVI